MCIIQRTMFFRCVTWPHANSKHATQLRVPSEYEGTGFQFDGYGDKYLRW